MKGGTRAMLYQSHRWRWRVKKNLCEREKIFHAKQSTQAGDAATRRAAKGNESVFPARNTIEAGARQPMLFDHFQLARIYNVRREIFSGAW